MMALLKEKIATELECEARCYGLFWFFGVFFSFSFQILYMHMDLRKWNIQKPAFCPKLLLSLNLNSECYFPIGFHYIQMSACVYSFAVAVITKYHRLKQQNFLFLQFWKSNTEVSAGLISSKSSLLGLQMATFSQCPHMAFALCLCMSGVYVLISFSNKDTRKIALGPTLTTSF